MQLYFYEMFTKHLNIEKKMYNVGLMLLHISLLEVGMNQYRPSILALSVIYLSSKFLKTNEVITDLNFLKMLVNVNDEEIRNCELDIYLLIDKVKSSQLSAVFRKFEKNKYNYVSTMSLKLNIN